MISTGFQAANGLIDSTAGHYRLNGHLLERFKCPEHGIRFAFVYGAESLSQRVGSLIGILPLVGYDGCLDGVQVCWGVQHTTSVSL